MAAISRFTSGPWRWLVLAFGTAALCFSNGANANIIAAWLAPLLVLRFVTQSPPLSGFAITAAVNALAAYITFNGAIPMPPAEYAITSLISGILATLPYLAHRLIAPRLHALLASLIFPTAMTALLFGLSAVSPFGTWGNDAYVQQAFAPLTQLASLGGIWLVSFFVYWFASAAQPLFDARLNSASITFAACLIAALAFGAWRLSPTPAEQTVRVAALSNPAGLADRFFENCPQRDDYACRQAGSVARQDQLFALSEAAVRNGAQIVVWYESAAQYDEQFESAFTERAQAFARQHGIYLFAGAVSVPNDPDALLTNKVIAFTPTGETAFEYLKAIPVPGEPIIAGDGQLQTVATPFGIIGAIICFDADFPALVRRAAQSNVDLMLVPANDWRAITPLHGDMTAFRAIETGTPFVRAASNGLSLATDSSGRVLARNNSFTTTTPVMIADIPLTRAAAPYAAFGDIFALLCCALFALLALGALIFPRKSLPA